MRTPPTPVSSGLSQVEVIQLQLARMSLVLSQGQQATLEVLERFGVDFLLETVGETVISGSADIEIRTRTLNTLLDLDGDGRVSLA